MSIKVPPRNSSSKIIPDVLLVQSAYRYWRPGCNYVKQHRNRFYEFYAYILDIEIPFIHPATNYTFKLENFRCLFLPPINSIAPVNVDVEPFSETLVLETEKPFTHLQLMDTIHLLLVEYAVKNSLIENLLANCNGEYYRFTAPFHNGLGYYTIIAELLIDR